MNPLRISPFVYAGQRVELHPGQPLGGLFERACYRLFLQDDGTGTLRRRDGTCQLRPGQLVIADPGDQLVGVRTAHVTRVAFDLWPRARQLRQGILIPGNDRPQPPLAEALDHPCDGRIPPVLETRATDIVLELVTLRPRLAVAVLRANAALARLLAAYLEYLEGPEPSAAPRSDFRHAVEILLMRHAPEGGSVSRAAALLGVTTAHLCKRYRQLTGTTPGRFLLRYRVAQAKELLDDHAIPIAEVARRVGCGSPSNFRALFRRQTGLAPRDWRRRRGR